MPGGAGRSFALAALLIAVASLHACALDDAGRVPEGDAAGGEMLESDAEQLDAGVTTDTQVVAVPQPGVESP